jgi:hypothetical protein
VGTSIHATRLSNQPFGVQWLSLLTETRSKFSQCLDKMVPAAVRRLFTGVKKEIPRDEKARSCRVVVFLCLHVELSAQVANGVQGEQAMQTQKVLADHSQIDSTTSHGFIDKGGVFTSLDFPGATETQRRGSTLLTRWWGSTWMPAVWSTGSF